MLKSDGLQVGDQAISVAISNPPGRKPPMNQREPSTFQPSLGGGKKEADRWVVIMKRCVVITDRLVREPDRWVVITYVCGYNEQVCGHNE